MLKKLNAMILQGYDTGNTSQVIRTFSAEWGRLSIMAKGLRSSKRGLAGVLSALDTVELTLFLREGAEMGTLHDAASVTSRDAIRSDLERFALASMLAEIASESCEIAQPSPEVFAMLEHAFHLLDPRSSQPAATAAVHGLIRLLALAGYEPFIEPELLQPWSKDRTKPKMLWLDTVEGRLHAEGSQPADFPDWPIATPPDGRHMPVPPEAARALLENTRTPDGELGLLPPLDSNRANQFIEALVRLARWHLGHPVRGARFWRRIVGIDHLT